MIDCMSLDAIAEEVARGLAYHTVSNEAAHVVTPLLYPGGARVVVRISPSEQGYFVSDYGAGHREGGLMGGDKIFTRIAREMAKRYGVRFDSDLVFDLDVPRHALEMAAMAVANASHDAVVQTAEKLSERRSDEQQEAFWKKLGMAFRHDAIIRGGRIMGSAYEWEFDALIQTGSRLAAFELVRPSHISVNSAVAKFLDLKDLGPEAPSRVAVIADKSETPHLSLLGRTAKIIEFKSNLAAYREAA